eukprot:TRINITY_DN9809_c0_g1_i1.p1 TRINITY_DN9809_c0_g1~~TRINITY_DN9809_c0_g1_i1.p1  ORF type:complete len:317 (-),score=57.78 TRINITY_DN9809_c0_g1_i1:65-1015(-)
METRTTNIETPITFGWLWQAVMLAWNLLCSIIEGVAHLTFSSKGQSASLNLESFDPLPLSTADVPMEPLILSPAPIRVRVAPEPSELSESANVDQESPVPPSEPSVTEVANSAALPVLSVQPEPVQATIVEPTPATLSASDDSDSEIETEEPKVENGKVDEPEKKKRRRRRGKKKSKAASEETSSAQSTPQKVTEKNAKIQTPQKNSPQKKDGFPRSARHLAFDKEPSDWRVGRHGSFSEPRRYEHSVLAHQSPSKDPAQEAMGIRPIRQPIGPSLTGNGFDKAYRESRLTARINSRVKSAESSDTRPQILKTLSV